MKIIMIRTKAIPWCLYPSKVARSGSQIGFHIISVTSTARQITKLNPKKREKQNIYKKKLFKYSKINVLTHTIASKSYINFNTPTKIKKGKKKSTNKKNPLQPQQLKNRTLIRYSLKTLNSQQKRITHRREKRSCNPILQKQAQTASKSKKFLDWRKGERKEDRSQKDGDDERVRPEETTKFHFSLSKQCWREKEKK